MKNKIIAILGAAAISIGTIGGVTFAKGIDNNSNTNQPMTKYMNNLSQEDYDKMIKIMNENGYGNMAQMMQSIGREGMVQMHNSMMGNGGNSNGMMGNFR